MTVLDKFKITAPDGACAEIYLNGAHVTSWVPAGGVERLFLSAASEFRPGAAIRGGVPVIFPQFASLGSLPKHGFARNQPWELESVTPVGEAVTATLTLHASAVTHQVWDYPFVASLTVRVGGPWLSVSLRIQNPGKQSFSFTGALHSYLRVDDLAHATLEGLGGRTYIDTVGGLNVERVQAEDLLRFDAETDRIYPQAPSPLVLKDATHRLEISASGFPDCVVWNPGPVLGAKLADLEVEGHRRYVCVEAAAAMKPVTLKPGQTWQGEQRLQDVRL